MKFHTRMKDPVGPVGLTDFAHSLKLSIGETSVWKRKIIEHPKEINDFVGQWGWRKITTRRI